MCRLGSLPPPNKKDPDTLFTDEQDGGKDDTDEPDAVPDIKTPRKQKQTPDHRPTTRARVKAISLHTCVYNCGFFSQLENKKNLICEFDSGGQLFDGFAVF